MGQLGIAIILLIGAGLLINSFGKLSRLDPGWNAAGVLNFYLVMPQDYPTARKAALIESLLTELRRMPEVRNAGYTYAGPLLGLVDGVGTFVPQGRTVDQMKDLPDSRRFAPSATSICRRWAFGCLPVDGSRRETTPRRRRSSS